MNDESKRPARINVRVVRPDYPVSNLAQLPDAGFYAIHHSSGERQTIGLRIAPSPDVNMVSREMFLKEMPDLLQKVMDLPHIAQDLGKHVVPVNQAEAFDSIYELLSAPHPKSRWHGRTANLPMLFLWCASNVLIMIDKKPRLIGADLPVRRGTVSLWCEVYHFVASHRCAPMDDKSKIPDEVVREGMIEQIRLDYPFIDKVSFGWETTIVFE